MTACCETTGCCETTSCGCDEIDESYVPVSELNTLAFKRELCINCGMCTMICPQGVFATGPEAVQILRADACMECGACQRNCPTDALMVDSGVGCAAAMINAALTGAAEPTC
jgi:NAD-dependent dihydropyrimidine dehydrogenase PreA subunit